MCGFSYSLNEKWRKCHSKVHFQVVQNSLKIINLHFFCGASNILKYLCLYKTKSKDSHKKTFIY